MLARVLNILISIPKWIVSALYGGLVSFERWHSHRTTYVQMMSLDDRLLEDIGLMRGDIWSVANSDFHRLAVNSNSAEQAAA